MARAQVDLVAVIERITGAALCDNCGALSSFDRPIRPRKCRCIGCAGASALEGMTCSRCGSTSVTPLLSLCAPIVRIVSASEIASA